MSLVTNNRYRSATCGPRLGPRLNSFFVYADRVDRHLSTRTREMERGEREGRYYTQRNVGKCQIPRSNSVPLG